MSSTSNDHDFVEALMIDKTQLLFREAGTTMFASLFAGGIWCGAIRHTMDAPRVLLVWYGLLILAIALRWLVRCGYRRDSRRDQRLMKWYVANFTAILLSTSVWSIGTTMIVWNAPLEARLITEVFLISVSGAGLVAYGWFPGLALSVIVITLLPAFMLFLHTDQPFADWMAVGVLWFFLSALRTTYVYSSRSRESFLQTHRLREANRIALWHAQTDSLTGLKNRRAFTSDAQVLVELARRERRPVSVMVIDLDRFKSINDDHGHSVGDTVLQRAATVMTESVRRSDVCGRLGGDEFAVILPNTDFAGAQEVAAKLLERIGAVAMRIGEQEVRIRMSVGIACGTGEEEFDALLARADRDMYRAKRDSHVREHTDA